MTPSVHMPLCIRKAHTSRMGMDILCAIDRSLQGAEPGPPPTNENRSTHHAENTTHVSARWRDRYWH